jgi:hypothetical protein
MINGRTHRLFSQNGQDAAFGAAVGPGHGYGVVLDGCGAKWRQPEGAWPSRNELGALLLGQFLSARLRRLAESKQPLADGIAALGEQTRHFLEGIVAAVAPVAAERERFVATRLLCTVVGFVIQPEHAVVFWAGDGAILVNDEVLSLDAGNRPDYPAHALLDGELRPYTVLALRDRPSLYRLAVATDGWQPAQLRALPATPSSRLLQRWLNREATVRGQFEDDAALTLWRRDAEETAP